MEHRALVLGIISFLIWLPYVVALGETFLKEKKHQKILLRGFVTLCIFSQLLISFHQSPYIKYFGVVAEHSKVQLTWWPRITEFFPRIPHEVLFFALLLSFGILVIQLLWKGDKIRSALWFGVVLQTFLHTSLHSPYSYLPHFEQPASSGYWYHSYVFPGAKGAVNEDYYWFWQAEALYLGASGPLSLFWGRVLPYFLSSRFTVFFHPYYVWVVLNSFAWLLSVLSVYSIARFYFNERIAKISAFLQLSSPALICYVAQAKPYALAFSMIAVLLAMFLALFKKNYRPYFSALLFGCCLGVTLLCYELQPWLLVLPLWARSLKIKWRDIFIFTAVGVVIYVAFNKTALLIPLLTPKDTFQPGYGSPLSNAVELFTSFDVGRQWETFHYALKSWWVLSFHAFSTLLPFAILGGYWLIRDGSKVRGPLLLLVPGIIACLLIGVTRQTLYFQYPRMVFGNYVAMILLSAFAIDRLSKVMSSRIAWIIVGLNFLYWNLDVFGVPAIYFHWFYRFPAHANWF